MKVKQLGFWTLLAVVIGNMIGSGAFLLPASIAEYGSIGLVAWFITTIGAICLAMVFMRLSRHLPKVGGPYAYCRSAYGDVIGFQVAFNYWIALWVGNAAIAVAFVSYLAFFFPDITSHDWISFLISAGMIWLLTLLNLRGARDTSLFQFVTNIIKLIPLLALSFIGLFFIHVHNLTAFNISNHTGFAALTASGALTFWSFIGLESATVPAESVDNPKRVIPLATIWGIIIAAVVYMLGTLCIMGSLPMTTLAHTSAPYATAGEMIFGKWAGIVFAIAAIIATLGSLAGWILLQGQIPYAAAKDQLFPKLFIKLNRYQSPYWGLIISSLLATLLLLLNFHKSLVHQFSIIILLATFASIIPYLYSCMGELILIYKKEIDDSHFASALALAIITFIIMFWVIAGTGKLVAYYWIFLMMLSIPVYVWMKWQNRNTQATEVDV